MAITYFVPKIENPTLANDYNPQLYNDGTTQQTGWLTLEEWQAAFPLVEPTPEELYNAERAVVDKKYNAPWDGATAGICIGLQMTIISAQAAGNDTAALYQQYNDALTAMAAEFDVIDEKYGVA